MPETHQTTPSQGLPLSRIIGLVLGPSLLIMTLLLPAPARPALALLLAGSLLFAGALAWKALAGGSPAAAPFGGGMMLLGWLLYAAAALRA